jgi:hypothetical protein
MKIFPLSKGGRREAAGDVRSLFRTHQHNPLKAFAFFPPLIRGIFEDDE